MLRHLPKLILVWLASSVVTVPVSMNLLVATLTAQLRAKRAAEFAPYADQIRGDFARVEKTSLFPRPTFRRDADSLFRAHIDYDREGRLASSPRAALALIDEKFPNWRTHETDVRGLLDDVLLNALDTRWIEELASFDHWAPYRTGDLAPLTGLERAAAFLAMARPNYAQVHDVALLHLLQSVKRGDAAGGLARLNQVASLAATTGAQDGTQVAVALVRLEDGLAKAFGIARPPLDVGALEAYARLGGAWVRIARLTQTQDAGFDAFFKPETGACAAAADVALGITPFADYLTAGAPFEADFSRDLARERAFRAKLLDVCGLDQLKAFVTEPHPGGWWQNSVRTPAGATPAMPNFARLPYLRRVVGVYVMLQTN